MVAAANQNALDDIQTVLDTMQENGELISFEREVVTDYDPEELTNPPTEPPTDPLQWQFYGLPVDISINERLKDSNFKATDMYIYIAANQGYEPKKMDKVTLSNNAKYAIVDVGNPVREQGTDILYKIRIGL